jgi:hypothetical protein
MRTLQCERPRRNVFADDGAGTGVGVVPNRNRSDQDRVGADLDAVADLGEPILTRSPISVRFFSNPS